MNYASKEEWLEWFFLNADFGPADFDVKYAYEDLFERRTGKKVPVEWSVRCDEELEEDDE